MGRIKVETKSRIELETKGQIKSELLSWIKSGTGEPNQVRNQWFVPSQ